MSTYHSSPEVKYVPEMGIQHLSVSGFGGNWPFCIIYKKCMVRPLAVVIKLLIFLLIAEVKYL